MTVYHMSEVQQSKFLPYHVLVKILKDIYFRMHKIVNKMHKQSLAYGSAQWRAYDVFQTPSWLGRDPTPYVPPFLCLWHLPWHLNHLFCCTGTNIISVAPPLHTLQYYKTIKIHNINISSTIVSFNTKLSQQKFAVNYRV